MSMGESDGKHWGETDGVFASKMMKFRRHQTDFVTAPSSDPNSETGSIALELQAQISDLPIQWWRNKVAIVPIDPTCKM